MKDSDIFNLFEREMFSQGFSTCGKELLAQCALSFARTNYGNGSLFKGIADELVQRELTLLTDRALGDVLWSFSKPSFKHDELGIGKAES